MTTTEPTIVGEPQQQQTPTETTDTDTEPDNPGAYERLQAWLNDQRDSFPQFYSERPWSLAEIVAYSRRGEWTVYADGQRRTAHLIYTNGVAVPVTAALLTAVWIVRSPARIALAAVLAVVLGTALNSVPLAHWLIPNALDVTAWWAWLSSLPPLSWLM